MGEWIGLSWDGKEATNSGWCEIKSGLQELPSTKSSAVLETNSLKQNGVALPLIRVVILANTVMVGTTSSSILSRISLHAHSHHPHL